MFTLFEKLCIQTNDVSRNLRTAVDGHSSFEVGLQAEGSRGLETVSYVLYLLSQLVILLRCFLGFTAGLFCVELETKKQSVST
jgi:hypothetical protein